MPSLRARSNPDPAQDLGLLRQVQQARSRGRARPSDNGRAASAAAPAPRQAALERPPPAPPVRASQPAPGRVIAREPVGSHLLILKVERPAGLDFVPGQYVRMGVGGETHPYSIASAPAEPLLEFCLELVPGGRLTPKLWRLGPGDRVALGERAKGSFVLDPGVSRHFLLATVTGVAPFVSMLRHHLESNSSTQQFYLLHGASYAEELVYRRHLERLAEQSGGRFTYVPAVSRPSEPRNSGFTGEHGRLTAIAARHAEAFGLDAAPACVYACGHPAMVAAIQAQFETDTQPVRTESFFKA